MVIEKVHQGFIGLSRQSCRFHELPVAERAKTAADPATGALLLRRALCKAGERSLQNIHRYSVSLCTELLCPATADKGHCGRNLSSFLDPGTCVICAFCGPPGFCVNSFSPITMKYVQKCMCEKSENNQTWFTIDHPKEHSILHQTAPFFIVFSCPYWFFRKRWCGSQS